MRHAGQRRRIRHAPATSPGLGRGGSPLRAGPGGRPVRPACRRRRQRSGHVASRSPVQRHQARHRPDRRPQRGSQHGREWRRRSARAAWFARTAADPRIPRPATGRAGRRGGRSAAPARCGPQPPATPPRPRSAARSTTCGEQLLVEHRATDGGRSAAPPPSPTTARPSATGAGPTTAGGTASPIAAVSRRQRAPRDTADCPLPARRCGPGPPTSHRAASGGRASSPAAASSSGARAMRLPSGGAPQLTQARSQRGAGGAPRRSGRSPARRSAGRGQRSARREGLWWTDRPSARPQGPAAPDRPPPPPPGPHAGTPTPAQVPARRPYARLRRPGAGAPPRRPPACSRSSPGCDATSFCLRAIVVPRSNGRTASSTGAKAASAATSRQAPTSTMKARSAASRAASRATVDLPMPASPLTTIICGLRCTASLSASPDELQLVVTPDQPSRRGLARHCITSSPRQPGCEPSGGAPTLGARPPAHT